MKFTISRSPIARGRSGQKQSCCGRDKARQARVARREIQGASERVSCSVQPNTIRPSKRAGRVVVPKEMGCVVLADWVQKAPQHRSVRSPHMGAMFRQWIYRIRDRSYYVFAFARVHSNPTTPNSPIFFVLSCGKFEAPAAFSPNVYFQSKSALSPLHVSLPLSRSSPSPPLPPPPPLR